MSGSLCLCLLCSVNNFVGVVHGGLQDLLLLWTKIFREVAV
jgi:hypothetical protein